MCRSISVHEGLLFFQEFCTTMDSLEPTIKSAYEVIKKFAKAEEQQGLEMKPIGDDPTQPPYQLSQWRFRVAYRLFTSMVDTIRAKDTIREMSWDIAFNFTNQKYFFEQALSLMILEKNPEIPEDIFKTPAHLQRMESLLFAGYYNLLDTTFDEEHGISCVRLEYMMELVRMVQEGKGDRISVLKKLKFAYDEFKTSLRKKAENREGFEAHFVQNQRAHAHSESHRSVPRVRRNGRTWRRPYKPRSSCLAEPAICFRSILHDATATVKLI